jgi:pre-rRNA-processing protein TSR4
MAEEEDITGDELRAEGGLAPMLGFLRAGCNPLFEDPDCEGWDGGRAGGVPVWLDREHVPAAGDMLCRTCTEPLAFLLQIYCPLESPESAYHRCLYLFCCRKASCVNSGSFKCLRVQCPKEAWPMQPAGPLPPLCAVCGCNGPNACARCKSVHYCSKLHQKAHWGAHKLTCGAEAAAAAAEGGEADPTIFNTAVFPEHDMVVEPEEIGDEVRQGNESKEILDEAMKPDVGPDEEDEDEDLTQNDYDKAIGAPSADPVYVRFLARVRRGGADQVLRYIQPRDGGEASPAPAPAPLPVFTGSPIDQARVPHCEHCGAHRQFEFQVMPQLLFYLSVDKQTSIVSPAGEQTTQRTVATFHNPSNEDIDWNSLDVYTCSASCGGSRGAADTVSAPEPCYKEEFVYSQQQISQVRISNTVGSSTAGVK